MSAALDYSTRTIKIYSGAYDPAARASIAEHLADAANPHGVTKAQVGLGDVDNTSDADKPVSTAQADALALKAPLLSPALTGTPTAPTAAPGTVTTQLATTAFAQAAANAAVAPVADAAVNLAAHEANHDNPHAVTKAQLGLGNVDNTADADKPVSAPQQAALNATNDNLATVAGDLDLHEASTSNPHSVTKAQVGLGAVDNTADLDKPVSGPQQAAINAANANTADLAAELAAHTADIDNPHAVSKADVGLGSADNTADLDKPVSTATQTALNATDADLATVAGDLATHEADAANPHAVTKAQVGLGAVDNTADANKPVSAPQQIALNLKAPLASPALTGVPTAPTASPGTASVQIATTAFVGAADAIVAAGATAAQADADQAIADAAAAQADATQALSDAAAAQSAADAAQADATAALILAAPVPALVAGVPSRPGDATALYGQTKTGAADAVVPIDSAWSATSAAGQVVRVNSAVAGDPQTIAPAAAYPVDPGRVYELRWRVQRQTDPVDPLNDSVTCGIQWLTNAKASNGLVIVENIALIVANGVQQRIARIGVTPPVAAVLDYVAPVGTIYFRPYLDLFGDNHVTDAITIDVLDITSAFEPFATSVNVAAPASGAMLVLDDTRPLYVDNPSSLDALTIRLPPVLAGGLLEIGFRRSVTALALQNDAGVAITDGPTGAYGPGAAIQMRCIDSVIGWVLWK